MHESRCSTCNVILVTRSIRGEEGLKGDPPLAKGLRGVSRSTIGSDEGLKGGAVAELIRVLESKVGLLESKVGSLEKDKVEKSLKIESLEGRVRSLALSLDAYKLLRNRFISTFKDKLGNTDDADRRIIRGGNGCGHGGDAAIDVLLYQGTGGRRDFTVFEKLYGFPPETVQRISGHQATIDVLNIHAEIAASNHKVGSNKFYKLFAEFVRLFKESGYEEGYLDGGSTDVTCAYWAFINCIKDEVTMVDDVEASD